MAHLLRRRALAHLAALPAAAAAAALVPSPAAARPDDDRDGDGDDRADRRAGLVFTSSNDAAGNALLVHARAAGGALALRLALPTGGLGSGSGLGSQGAVTLGGGGRRLYVVNAGSHTVSTFTLGRHGIALTSVVDAGGLHPISVAEDDGLVYVLSDGGSGNIHGFRDERGVLTPLAGSRRPLSTAGGSAPAQVAFGHDGRVLLVTEKATHRLLSWPVERDGRPGAVTVQATPGRTPFGFAVTRRNDLVVSEAWGGAAGASTVSSWSVEPPARVPRVVSGAVPNGQGAACWVAVTADARHAFVANTGSSSMSRYAVAADGRLTLAEAVAGHTGPGSTPSDTAISGDGRWLHVRSGATASIASFAIDDDARLGPLRLTSGLPPAAVGMAAL